VNLPNGKPVPNAVVVIKFSKFNGQEQVGIASQFARQELLGPDFLGTYTSICAVADDESTECDGAKGGSTGEIRVRTNDQGISKFKGFDDSVNSPEVTANIYAYFQDDSTYQQTETQNFSFTDENIISLEYMPWFETVDKNLSGKFGDLVPVEVNLQENTSQLLTNTDYSGYEVKVTPPVGAKNKSCTSKSKLRAKTNVSGIAKFKVCASKSGTYRISSPGVVSSSSIEMKVIGAPPARPSVKSYETPSKKTIELFVKAPEYTGGARITKYKLVVSGSEKGGMKQFTKTFSFDYTKSSQKIRLTGINSYGTSSVKVYAVTKNGTGDFVEVFPTLW
jgi:hypothetical protein